MNDYARSNQVYTHDHMRPTFQESECVQPSLLMWVHGITAVMTVGLDQGSKWRLRLE